ncbi:zinc finger protein 37 homolog isoform X2 [Zeugodacus cucurbitae]|uniref:Zinc finger protein 239 n=1 Tax=Zeugodacus cucurbitae TaxID=28588 RepID=A0A0A1WEZ2_ZEUCU|nr:zinc finger protein 37 homolog isoform X2 [Zeugodacus cucurbitae]
MEIERDNAKIQCTDFKKCGEIATLLSIGKPEFFLNCGFCEYTFLQLDNFIRHMYEDHQNEFPDCELKQELAEMVEEKYSSDTEEIEDHNSVNDFMLKGFEKVEIEVDTSEEHISIDIGENFKKEYWDEEDEEDLLENTLPASAQEECLKEDKKKITETQKYKNELLDDELYSEDTLDDFTITERITKVEIESTSIRRRNEKRKKNTSKDGRMSEETATDSDIPEENENLSYIEENRHIPKKRLKLEEKELANNSDEFDDSNVGKISEENEVSDSGHSENKKKGSLYEAQTKTILKPTKVAIPNIILNDKQCKALADIYKTHACLWDEKDITYRFCNRREEALKSILEKCNETFGLSLTQNELEREIVRMRKITSIEKRQKILSKRKNIKFKPLFCTYYKHIEYLEVDVSPFECTICETLLPGLGKLKVHVASHDGSLPFKCHLCGHGFQLASNLTIHLRRHVQDYIYVCEICNKSYATTTDLKIHMRTHTGERPYVCSICGQSRTTASHLFLHTLRHQNRRRHQCKICSKAFISKGTLKDHMLVHSQVRDNICDICQKGFKTKKHLYQHKLIHSAEKKYECKFCGKRFAQSAGLKGHMKTHGTKLSAT